MRTVEVDSINEIGQRRIHLIIWKRLRTSRQTHTIHQGIRLRFTGNPEAVNLDLEIHPKPNHLPKLKTVNPITNIGFAGRSVQRHQDEQRNITRHNFPY